MKKFPSPDRATHAGLEYGGDLLLYWDRFWEKIKSLHNFDMTAIVGMCWRRDGVLGSTWGRCLVWHEEKNPEQQTMTVLMKPKGKNMVLEGTNAMP